MKKLKLIGLVFIATVVITLILSINNNVFAQEITGDDIQEIIYTPVEPYKYIYEVDGTWQKDYEGHDFFLYSCTTSSSGDKITIKLKNGTERNYTYKLIKDGYYFNDDETNEKIDVQYSDNQFDTHWTLGKNNHLTVTCLGVETLVPVEIVENEVKSFQFIPEEPFQLMEDVDFNMSEVRVWNEQTNSYEYEEFKYYYLSLYKEGTRIVVEYKDSNRETSIFTFSHGDKWGYFDQNGEELQTNYLRWTSDQNKNHWTAGNTYNITVSYMGYEQQIPVTMVENPVSSIDYRPANPYEFMEKTHGRTGYGPNDEEYFHYYIYSEYDDELIVSYKNGTTKTFKYNYNDEFQSDDGECIKHQDIELNDGDQYNNHWTTDSDNFVTISYLGKEVKKRVTIVENPVVSIEYIPAKSLELIENVDGFWTSVDEWNEETNQLEQVKYFYYETFNINRNIGDVLVINEKNGSKRYTFESRYNTQEGYYEQAYYNADGEKLEANEVYIHDNQNNFYWTRTTENKIIVEYNGRKTELPVTIKENPVISISYSPKNPVKLVENVVGYYDKDNDGNEFFIYDTYCYEEGDILTVKEKDGTKTYTYKFGDDNTPGGYYNTLDENDRIDWVMFSDNQEKNHWGIGKHKVTITYMNRETEIEVEVIENEVKAIKYEPISSYEFEENTHGAYHNVYDYEHDVYIEKVWMYDYYLKDGDKLTVVKKDNSEKTYTFKTKNGQEGFYDGDTYALKQSYYSWYDVNVEDNQYPTGWKPNGDNYIIIRYMGREAKIPVTISSGCKHESLETKNAKTATCNSEGYTGDKVCKNCGKTIQTGTKIAKTAHKFGAATTTKATTSKDGKITKKCTVCGTTETQKIYYPKTITLSKTKFTYNNKTQKPKVTVKGSDGKVIAASNYTVIYAKGNKDVGRYNVKIAFKGKYTGTKTLTFDIVPKGTSLSKLKAGSKKLTAYLKKQTTKTTGYEIQYTTDKAFKTGTTKVKITSNKTTSKTISNLKKKKKYYVRVRTYKTVKFNGNNIKVYSDWSKVLNVKTK